MDRSCNLSTSTLEETEQGILSFFSQLETSDNIDNAEMSEQTNTLEQYSDGVKLMRYLSKVNPTYFNLSLMETDTGDNWALKHKNLTKLLQSLDQYYTQVLKLLTFEPTTYVDLSEISQHSKKEEIIKLIELVLGVLVQSEQKSEYIQVITQLDKRSQTVLMHLMEKWIAPSDSTEDHDQFFGMNNSQINSMYGSNISQSPRVSIQNNSMMSIQSILAKVDELERENNKYKDTSEEFKAQYALLQKKVTDLEKVISKKEDEAEKARLEKESTSLVLGLNTEDDIQTVVKAKDKQIEEGVQRLILVEKARKDEKVKLENEIEILSRKLTQLQKQNESMEYYKTKSEEAAALAERITELEKNQKSAEKLLSEKETQNAMLMDKLQEFKQSYNEEKRKGIEKDIQLTQYENSSEQMKHELEQLEKKLKTSEEHIRDILREEKTKQEDELKLHQKMEELKLQKKASGKPLGAEFGEIITSLEEQNMLLKFNQSYNNDVNGISIEDKETLISEIELWKMKFGESDKQRTALQSKINELQKQNFEEISKSSENANKLCEELQLQKQQLVIDNGKLKNECDKAKSDYEKLLEKTLKRKEQKDEETQQIISALQQEKEQKEEQVSSISKQLVELQTNLDDAKSQIASCTAQLKNKDTQHQSVVQNFNATITQLNGTIENKDKQLQANSVAYKNLLQNKTEEQELVYSVICDIRRLHQQVAKESAV